MAATQKCLVGKTVTFHGENDKGKQSVDVDVCTAIKSHGDGTNMSKGCYNLNDKLLSNSQGDPLFKKAQSCYVTSIDIPKGAKVTAWHLDGQWGDRDCTTESWFDHGRHSMNSLTGPKTMKPDAGVNSTCAFRIQPDDNWTCETSSQACKVNEPTPTPTTSSSTSECAVM